jgi:PTS system nitrogen regulatory IIA component
MHFGSVLGLLRAQTGQSLRGLSGRAGVSAAYLSRLEHGHDPAPPAERAAALAGALGIPPQILYELIDEVRGDAADWVRATATGRRLVAALRRRELGEAQLARVLAFVQQEFPLADPGLSAAQLLEPARVLPRVRAGALQDAWALAALRLAGPASTAEVYAALSSPEGGLSGIGAGVALRFVRGHAEAPRACLLIGEAPWPLTAPDAEPIYLIWALVGIGEGPIGAEALAAVARTAAPGLTRALCGAATGGQALALLQGVEAGPRRR